MIATKKEILSLLQLVRGKIRQLPARRFFKDLLLEDIDLAINAFRKGAALTSLNSISVIVDKIHTKLKICGLDRFAVAPLLNDIHRLQQMLVVLPIPAAIPGPPGPCGPRGAAAHPRTGNLIVNGDFEEDNFAEAWHPRNAKRLEASASQRFSGDWIAWLDASTIPYASINQLVSLHSELPYQLTFALRYLPVDPQVPGEIALYVTYPGFATRGFKRNLTVLGDNYHTLIYLLNPGPNAENIPKDAKQANIGFIITGAATAYLDLITFGA